MICLVLQLSAKNDLIPSVPFEMDFFLEDFLPEKVEIAKRLISTVNLHQYNV